MLSMSMVTSLGQIEVFMNSIKEVQLTVEELQTYLEMPELPEPEKPAALRDYSVELKKCISLTPKTAGMCYEG